ncbi:GTPase Era [Leucobacter sp. OLJS4]|uniref:GTPase Era n=1 Tax=unclassified Leucobacter TaxID=2621730 RepID=UPI000C186B46|nr:MULTISPECIES: GTPase Era [unclassified Leucobacter]PIJ26798.1 GTPase Era [Leucobacter sp. OLES1]PII81633.1 GTPase Era [Leucobacter sp. OLCALW19]PII86304.1 GTPase Era [Leucobacter sp. OLTLW20]PII90199.1 GTPase Era [Leucobacter sp. OLAS13]PII97232.1 GTPase Era [Leucobacter sp. OLDS2]
MNAEQADGVGTEPEGEHRAGFVSFVGRPNVGKSTLTNALVGQKIAITSPKPQTTRRAIRGIVHRPDGQLIIVDTPGIHRPRTLLGERLNALVEATLGDVDVIGFCVPADEKLGPGDRFINERLDDFPRAKKVAILTKVDEASSGEIIDQLTRLGELREWDAVVPISAVTRDQLDVLSDVLLELMPVSPPLYEAEQITDENEDDRIAELIREAALDGMRDELPHSLAATVDDREEREDGLLALYASIYVERDSQKGIVIGKGGSQLRDIGERARHEIEALLGRRIYLSLRVKLLKEWQRDPKALGRLGF